MALAVLFRSAAATIGLGLAYLMAVEELATRALTPLGGDVLKMVEKLLPGQTSRRSSTASGRRCQSR